MFRPSTAQGNDGSSVGWSRLPLVGTNSIPTYRRHEVVEAHEKARQPRSGAALDPHHAKNGSIMPGDADSGRGGSAIRDAGRLVHTLAAMGEDEARTFEIPQAERHSYVRLDKAKINLATKSANAKWFKLVGVRLRNGTTDYPNGDEVQTVVPWSPPDTWANLSIASLNAALTEIDAGMEGGRRYSDANAARDRAAWRVVQRHCPDKTEQQCREIIKTWVKNGVLHQEEYDDPIKRQACVGLCLDASKRPG
jgi:hypothetical protein